MTKKYFIIVPTKIYIYFDNTNATMFDILKDLCTTHTISNESNGQVMNNKCWLPPNYMKNTKCCSV